MVYHMNLSPPPSKTPPIGDDKQTLCWQWQRWYSDLYEYVKELETRIKTLEAKK